MLTNVVRLDIRVMNLYKIMNKIVTFLINNNNNNNNQLCLLNQEIKKSNRIIIRIIIRNRKRISIISKILQTT